MNIIIDSREPGWVRRLRLGGAEISVMALDAGDVWLATPEGLVIIERKTPSDFLNSLRANRMFGQCAKMQGLSEWAYLCITGELQRGQGGKVWADRRQTGWNWHAVQGALLTVQELGVRVVFCGGDTDFEAAVLRIAKRDRGEVHIRPPRVSHILNEGEAMLAALPGVGPEKVDALLKHCGTPAWALVALTDNTPGVPGVRGGTKARVRKALGLEDWAEFAIYVKEEDSE